MKNVKCLTRVLAPIALLCGASAASAADSGFYFGLSLGEAKYDVEEGTSGAFTTVTTSRSFDTDSTVGVSAGYRFSRHLGIEANYIDLGTYKYSETGRNPGPTSGALDAEASAAGIGLALVVTAPIGNWDIHAKVGGLSVKTEATQVIRSQTLAQQTYSASATTFETTYGLGVGYSIGEHYNVALDWTGIKEVGDDVDTGEADVSIVSLGVSYRF